MAYQITSDCTNCGECVGTCPVGAIAKGAEIYEISDECIDCGACVGFCPDGVDAIVA